MFARGLDGVAFLMLMLVPATRAQAPFCLPDADGDGHPLFGNPEAMLSHVLQQESDSGLVPVAGAIGDLDGDGDHDAVATYVWFYTNQSDVTTLSVMLNQGDGVFVPDAQYECGNYPSSVAIGDVDGDSLNDLAVTNTNAGTVSVLINVGGGTFPERLSYAVGQKPRSSVIADLDGDGDRDLAVANVQGGSVSILLNDGSGVFGPQVQYEVDFIPVASYVFVDPLPYGGPYLSAADLDADDDINQIVPSVFGVTVLKNDGAATFAGPESYAAQSSVWGVAIGDVDGDSDADIVTANDLADSVSVLLNDGAGVFAEPASYSIVFSSPSGLYQPATVSLGDLDGDCDLDLAVGLATGFSDTPILVNQGDGTFGPVQIGHTEIRPVVANLADLNCDGHVDLSIFALDVNRERLCVLINDGTGTLVTDQTNYDWYNPPTPFYWARPYDVGIADMDTDGHKDLVILNKGEASIPGNVALMFGEGGGAFGSPVHYVVSDFAPVSLALGDLDGDSDFDVILAGPESISSASPGWVSVLLNNGSDGLGAASPYPTGGLSTRAVVLGDLDGDTDLDVIAANKASNSVAVLLNDGSGTLSPPQLSPVSGGRPGAFSNPRSIAIGLLNDDEELDLVLSGDVGIGPVSESLGLLWGTGTGSFAIGPTIGPPPGVVDILASDLDADGDADLVVSTGNEAWEEHQVTVLRNDGVGEFTLEGQFGTSDMYGSGALAEGDFDGNGTIDVAVLANDAITVLLNQGGLDLSASASYGVGLTFATSVAAGDLDGDGDIDLVTTNTGGNTVSFLWNQGCRLIRSDLDGDGDVDLFDYQLLAGCWSGAAAPPPGACASTGADLDHDADVDLADAALFQNEFNPT